ncbi:Aste57867_14195 [Aphanomyces stellatus]|uniref:Aste57867_14195 protein n=1 Tax=Aphanomyces stellatus TaxID=120398 RepID=A0A485L0X5_9STRA|nr:hypothetical protein As57867_014144 [Aphanomyces stellatus]VFT91020.1 Aste57867_14195 [Aphanomyces stellatus]
MSALVPHRPTPRTERRTGNNGSERIETDANATATMHPKLYTRHTSLPTSAVSPLTATEVGMCDKSPGMFAPPRFDRKKTSLFAKFELVQPNTDKPVNQVPSKETSLSLHRNMAALTAFNTKEKQAATILRQQLEDTRFEMDALKRMCQAMQYRTVRGWLIEVVVRWIEELEQVKSDGQRQLDEVVASMHASASSAVASKSNQTRKPDEVRKIEEQHNVEIFKWENKCNEITTNHKQLAKLLQKTQANERSLEGSLAEASVHIQMLEAKVAATTRELQTIVRAKATEDDAQKARVENDALRCKIVELNAALDEIHAKERDARNALATKTMQFGQEKEALLREISHARDDYAALRTTCGAEMDRLGQIIHRDEGIKADLESQVVDLTDKCIALDETASSLRKQIDFQTKVIDDKQLALEQTKTMVVKGDMEIERLMREIAGLEADTATMRERLAMVSDVWAACTTADPTVHALQQGRKGQNEALAIVLEEKNQVKAELAKARDEVDRLKQQIACAAPSADIVALQTQLTSMLNKKNELLLMLDQLKADFSHLTTDHTTLRIKYDELQVQCAELEEIAMDPAAVMMLKQAQLDLKDTVDKLVEAETSSEAAFTCLKCMSVFVRPVTLTTCGHTFCESCLQGGRTSGVGYTCKECGEWSSSDGFFANNALADLAARFVYRQQTVSSLTNVCQSLEEAFARPAISVR